MAVTLHSLPLFVRLAGRPVILIGGGEAAGAKRRLLVRAGATIVDEASEAALAIVVDDDAAVARLKGRGVLVNAVDRPELCDFTVPAIVERGDVIVAVGTGGRSAGLAAAVRQRVEAWLPAQLGALAAALGDAREAIRARWGDPAERRRAIGAALAPGGALDPWRPGDVEHWLGSAIDAAPARLVSVPLTSDDPDDLTLRDARWLGLADRVYRADTAPPAILARVRADAERIAGPPPAAAPPGVSVVLERAA